MLLLHMQIQRYFNKIQMYVIIGPKHDNQNHVRLPMPEEGDLP